MMSGFVMLVPLLLLLLLIWFTMRPKNRARFQLNKKFIYMLTGTYVVILLIATVTVEIYEKKFAAEMPDFVVDGAHSSGSSFEAFESMDPTFIIEKRTHPATDRLHITANIYEYEAHIGITIERKKDNDGVIEETIYQPVLINDGFDFSDRINYRLPEWNGNTVLLPIQPETTIQYASYRDAHLLNQFAKQPNTHLNARSYGGMSRSITVHLLVPKDLQIDAPEELWIDYLNESIS